MRREIERQVWNALDEGEEHAPCPCGEGVLLAYDEVDSTPTVMCVVCCRTKPASEWASTQEREDSHE